jgi:hypothetical protein
MSRPNNLSIVCLYLSLYISILLFGHFFFDTQLFQKKNVQNNKKEIYNDKYRHTRDRLFGLSMAPMISRSFNCTATQVFSLILSKAVVVVMILC